MASLTTPGLSDLHWMVVHMKGQETQVSFHEVQDVAEEEALAALNSIAGSSVYVAQVVRHGEHLRRPGAITSSERPTRPMTTLRKPNTRTR